MPEDGTPSPIIEVRAVSATFPTETGELHALKNVSFNINDQEFICILGPSGSGKSTLLRVLAGIWPYVRGWDGQHQPLPISEAVVLPPNSVFIPQRAYFPQGSLRNALASI